MRYSTFTKGRPASAASWALRIFEAATICIALVICAVLLMERMRRRKSRGLFINQLTRIPDPWNQTRNHQAWAKAIAASSPRFFELINCRFHFGCKVRAESFFARNPAQQFGLSGTQIFRQSELELLDPIHPHVIDVTVLNRPDHCHLGLDCDRAVL